MTKYITFTTKVFFKVPDDFNENDNVEYCEINDDGDMVITYDDDSEEVVEEYYTEGGTDREYWEVEESE